MNDRKSDTLMTDIREKLSLKKALFYRVFRYLVTGMTEMKGIFDFIKKWSFGSGKGQKT